MALMTLMLFRARRRDEGSRLKQGVRRRVRKNRQKEARDNKLAQITSTVRPATREYVRRKAAWFKSACGKLGCRLEAGSQMLPAPFVSETALIRTCCKFRTERNRSERLRTHFQGETGFA